jgi:hypothetical protein
MQQGPTLRDARLVTTHDAVVVCWAVAQKDLPLITRRLNSEVGACMPVDYEIMNLIEIDNHDRSANSSEPEISLFGKNE